MTHLWNRLKLKKICHLTWLSFSAFCKVAAESGVIPGKRTGAWGEGAGDGTGNSAFRFLSWEVCCAMTRRIKGKRQYTEKRTIPKGLPLEGFIYSVNLGSVMTSARGS